MATSFTQLIRDSAPAETVRPVPFSAAFRGLDRAGNRRLVATWAVVVALIVPSGLMTRLFEWTGIPVEIGGAQVYLTVYLPLLACVPLVLWLGYWWGAIPAYLSTFAVATLGGMPLPWIFLFALANPVGLAALNLAFRAFPTRPDLRSVRALLYFGLALLVSSIAGSAGSFIWAHTNQVGINQFYPVWQGWWLGGVAQGILIVAPALLLLTPSVERWKQRLGLELVQYRDWSRRSMLVAAGVMVATIAAYVTAVRYFMFGALDTALAAAQAQSLRPELANILEGLALPHWVLATLVAVTLFFGFRVGLSWSEQYRELAFELERANVKLKRAVITDALTGVYNRSHLLEVLPREISAAKRHGRPLACLVLDIDRFKAINDQLGHLAGDQVLVQIAGAISERLRAEDMVARIGGEEFIVLLPDTDAGGGYQLAEDIRDTIEKGAFSAGESCLGVTISIGVAELAEVVAGPDPVRELVSLADEALYEAKRSGRNRTVRAGTYGRPSTSL